VCQVLVVSVRAQRIPRNDRYHSASASHACACAAYTCACLDLARHPH
jgi:hypothetical protein